MDKKAKTCRIKNILPRVYVGWLCPNMPRMKRVGRTIYKERVKEEIHNLVVFFKDQFDGILPLDEQSIRDSIEQNETFFVFVFFE